MSAVCKLTRALLDSGRYAKSSLRFFSCFFLRSARGKFAKSILDFKDLFRNFRLMIRDWRVAHLRDSRYFEFRDATSKEQHSKLRAVRLHWLILRLKVEKRLWRNNWNRSTRVESSMGVDSKSSSRCSKYASREMLRRIGDKFEDVTGHLGLGEAYSEKFSVRYFRSTKFEIMCAKFKKRRPSSNWPPL